MRGSSDAGIGKLSCGPNSPGMDSRDFRVPRKIPIIQCQYARHVVNQHGRHEPRVMHFRAGNSVADNQATPLGMYALAVGQEPKFGLDNLGPLIDLGG